MVATKFSRAVESENRILSLMTDYPDGMNPLGMYLIFKNSDNPIEYNNIKTKLRKLEREGKIKRFMRGMYTLVVSPRGSSIFGWNFHDEVLSCDLPGYTGERIIFEDVKESKKTQKELHIADNFKEIYQEELYTRQIVNFNKSLFHYAILILADKSLGKPDDPDTIRKKIDLISNVALNPSNARNFVERNRYRYDLDGNLDTEITSELRYSSKAVQKALDIFRNNSFDYKRQVDRSRIDLMFLTGYFTPTGFVKEAEFESTSTI